MPDKLPGTPKSHSQRGGLLASASYPDVLPRLSLPHPRGMEPLELPVCVAGLAGLAGGPQLGWGGDTLSEEGHSLVAHWHPPL